MHRHDHFLEDPSEPPIFRARLSDYRGSGYDRGHMAAAADMKHSQQAMDSTFLLSNMCPQVGAGFNRDYWARFEQFAVRLLASQFTRSKINEDGLVRHNLITLVPRLRAFAARLDEVVCRRVCIFGATVYARTGTKRQMDRTL